MTWLRVCNVADLSEGSGTPFEITGETTVALFTVDGEVFAVNDRCSHAEASLSEGEVFGCEVECPRHGAAFNLSTGEPLTLPATVPLATYDVRIEDGAVSINVGDAV